VLGSALICTDGLTFDLSTPHGKLITNLAASVAEFEHDLLRQRVRSGIAAAKARGQTFGRTPGYRPSDKHTGKVIRLIQDEYLPQRQVAKRLGISKTTVNEIVKRHRHHAMAVIGSTAR
jgi:putative DNA-invertase from lambdoid prophage Rac